MRASETSAQLTFIHVSGGSKSNLANQFWVRWKREYLQTMKVVRSGRCLSNFTVDDVVLVYDEHAPRGKWPLGRVVETYPDKQDHVRQVLVRTSTGNVKRPISKLFRVA